MAKCKSPEEFDLTKPETWSQQRRCFERYRSASLLSDKDGKVQVDTLVYTMGPEAEALFDSFTFAPVVPATALVDQHENYDITIKKI